MISTSSTTCESTSESCDNSLDTYLVDYGRAFEMGFPSTWKVKHEFIPLFREAQLERSSLFVTNYDINVEQLSKVCTALLQGSDLQYSAGEVKRHLDIESIVFVALGSSSTQVYCKDKLVAAFYVGSECIEKDLSLLRELMANIYNAMLKLNLQDYTLFLFKNFGFFGSGESYASSPNVAEFAQYRGVTFMHLGVEHTSTLFLLEELHDISKSYSMKIIRSTYDAERNVKCNWVTELGNQYASLNPEGVYCADFGGGGPRLRYIKKDASGEYITEEIRSHGSYKFSINQIKFIEEMQRRDYDSTLKAMTDFLIEKVALHAHNAQIHSPEVYILQTGMARQLFEAHSFEPLLVNMIE